MSLFHAHIAEFLRLSVSNDTNNAGKLGNTGQLSIDLTAVILVLLSIFAESLFLRSIPVLVATTLEFLTKMLGKYGTKTVDS